MAEHDSDVDSERQALLEHLQRHRVEGVVIGGVAIQTHRPAYRTDDVDFEPATDPANLRRLAAALNALDLELVVSRRAPRTTVALPHDYFTARSLMNQPFWNLATVFGDLDICFVAAGFPRAMRICARARPSRPSRARASRCRSRRLPTSSIPNAPSAARRTSTISNDSGQQHHQPGPPPARRRRTAISHHPPERRGPRVC